MNKFFTLIVLCLTLTRVTAQVDCPQGYVERNIECNGNIIVKCVPENYTCNGCWILKFAPCPGQTSGGSRFYGSYERALQAAQKESNNWHHGQCTWWDNRNYKIYIDDSKYCSTNLNDEEVLKNDLLNKVKPFLQRYKAEIANYRRYFNGQLYKPSAVFKEYETQLKQAEENVLNLESMLNNINDNNLHQIENAFNDLQKEQQNLKQADANYKTQINTEKQEELNRQQSEETNRQKQQQLEQQRKSQEKIEAQMRELTRKSQAQANVASSILDGLSSILGTIQANQAKRSIAEDNNKRAKQFEELKKRVQNEEGELAECSSCYGEGYKDCRICNSKGKKTCGVCYGKAGETCSICRGSGTYQVGTVKMSCTSCFGKGVKNCSYCGNTGQTLCSSCNGLGRTQCNHCYGTGQEFKMDYSNQYKSNNSSSSYNTYDNNNSYNNSSSSTGNYKSSGDEYFEKGNSIKDSNRDKAVEYWLLAAKNGHIGCKEWADKIANENFEEGNKIKETDRNKAIGYWLIAAKYGHRGCKEWADKIANESFEEGNKLKDTDRNKAIEYWKLAAKYGHQGCIKWINENTIK